MKPLILPDDHSPVKPPPTSDLNIREVMQYSESDKDDINSNPIQTLIGKESKQQLKTMFQISHITQIFMQTDGSYDQNIQTPLLVVYGEEPETITSNSTYNGSG